MIVSWASSRRWIIDGTSSAPFGGRSIEVSSAAWRGSPTAMPPRLWTRSASRSIELELLVGVLVEQEVELIEGGAGDEPVVLLVERVQDHRVGQDLVEELAALLARLGGQGDRQEAQAAESLDLDAHPGEARLGGGCRLARGMFLRRFGGGDRSSLASSVTPSRPARRANRAPRHATDRPGQRSRESMSHASSQRSQSGPEATSEADRRMSGS